MADDQATGQGLWRTDGTPEGTKVLVPSSPAGGPVSLARFGNEAAFSLSLLVGDTFHNEIWLTDGTAAGTRKQVELPAGTATTEFAFVAGRLWFFDSIRLPDGEYALQPWVSDGTPAGTYRLTGRNGYTLADRPTFTGMGGRVYFSFAELGAPLGIWSTDGTPAGTGPAITAGSGAAAPESLTAIGDRLYMTAPRAGDAGGPLLPWISDGTDAGTALLADVDLRGDPNFAPPDPHPFTELDGRVFFAGSDLQHRDELWCTDGTPAGTARLLDIAPGLMGSYPRGLTVWNGKLWFRARDAAHGMELWSSDGTAEGTRLVQDIAPGPSWSVPAEMAAIAEGLYFSAADGEHGRELWVLPKP
jgi:ELWxxDGT repeat protein